MGLLLGGGAMMVLAPQSGEKTRDQLQTKGMELVDQAVEALEDTAAQAKETVRVAGSNVFKQAEELAQRGQAVFDGQRQSPSPCGEATQATAEDSQI
jgi:gas vesicle protein